jgi:hypothetical protein
MSKTLTLIRGLPGSGKTTLACRDYVNSRIQTGEFNIHAEADQFFIAPDGSYLFDGTKLGEAHAHCNLRVFTSMALGRHVVITNTFSQKWEMVIYAAYGVHFHYKINIIDLFDAGLTDMELAARCVHGCPETKIAQMRERWEK